MIQTNYIKYLLLENVKQGKKILTDKGLNPEQETDFNDITYMLRKNPNLIGNFVKYRYEDNVDINSIKRVVNWLISNKPSISTLPKNLIDYDSFEELDDDVTASNTKKVANKFYNKLYKSIVNEFPKLSDEQQKEMDELAYAFNNLEYDIQRSFLSVLKHFKRNDVSIEEFFNSFKLFMEKNVVNDNKKYVLDKIEELKDKIDVTYHDGDILIIQTNDKESIKELGSQKWCLVYASDTYYGRYVTNFATQYIIYNFNLPITSDYSMYGVTVKVDNTTPHGGCQTKFNSQTTIENINTSLNLEENMIVPSTEMVEKHRKYEEVKTKLTDADDIGQGIKILREYNFEDVFTVRQFDKFFGIEGNDGLKRELDKVWVNIPNKKYGLFIMYPELVGYYSYSDINVCYGLEIMVYFAMIDSFVNGAAIREELSLSNLNDYGILHELVKRDKLTSMANELTPRIKSDVNINTVIDNCIDRLSPLLDKTEEEVLSFEYETTFDEYKEFYDKFILNKADRAEEESDYTHYFENYIEDTFKEFIDDSDYILFLKEYLNRDFNIGYDENSELLDKTETYHAIQEIYKIHKDGKYIKEIECDIDRIVLYLNKIRVSHDMLVDKLQISQYEKEDGTKVDCLVFNDWTDLDEYYDYDPFEYVNDPHSNGGAYEHNSDLSDATSEFKDLANKENTILIAKYIVNSDVEIDNNELNTLITQLENSNDETQLESMKKLKIEMEAIIDEHGDDEISELGDVIKYSLDDIYDSKYYEEYHDAALSNFTDEYSEQVLDGDNFYKFIGDGKDGYKLYISIDVEKLIDVDLYDDLRYNVGEDFTLESLFDYVVGEKGTLDTPNNIYPSLDYNNETKSYYNERLGERFSEI